MSRGLRGRPAQTIRPDKDILERLYVQERKTGHDIAALYDVAPASVYAWFRFHGICLRRPIEKPSLEELHSLYVEQGLTTRQVAKRLAVCRNRLMAWIIEYGFEHHEKPGSLAAKGFIMPSTEELNDLVHVQHKTLTEIGTAYGVSGVAVRHWLKTRGVKLPTPSYTMTKGRLVGVTREQLERLHLEEHLTYAEIGKRIGVGQSTIGRLIKKYGILVLPKGQRRFFYQTEDGRFVRSTYERAVGNWLFSRGIAYEYEPRLPFGTTHRADFKIGTVFVEVWGVEQDPAYNRNKAWKQSKYASHGLPLVELEASHFRGIRQWETILSAAFLKSGIG